MVLAPVTVCFAEYAGDAQSTNSSVANVRRVISSLLFTAARRPKTAKISFQNILIVSKNQINEAHLYYCRKGVNEYTVAGAFGS